MENTFTQPNPMVLDQTALGYLNGSAKWSLFLAILGFIGVAFMVVMGIFMTTIMSSIPGMPFEGFGLIFGLFYLLIAVLYFFPIYFLYKYSSEMRSAITNKQADVATDAFRYLNSHHKYLGIMMLSMIALYIFIIIGAVIAGVASI